MRMELYHSRKAYLEGILQAESSRLNNQARFIMEKIEGKISIENKPKKELIRLLVQHGYDSDPIKAWKKEQSKLSALLDAGDETPPAHGSAGSGGGKTGSARVLH